MSRTIFCSVKTFWNLELLMFLLYSHWILMLWVFFIPYACFPGLNKSIVSEDSESNTDAYLGVQPSPVVFNTTLPILVSTTFRIIVTPLFYFVVCYACMAWYTTMKGQCNSFFERERDLFSGIQNPLNTIVARSFEVSHVDLFHVFLTER